LEAQSEMKRIEASFALAFGDAEQADVQNPRVLRRTAADLGQRPGIGKAALLRGWKAWLLAGTA
jgi:hypothetical protein